MTLLITGDLHLSSNPRDEYRHDFVESLVDIVTERDPIALLILGDLTEAKDKHNAELVNRVSDHFQAIAQRCPIIFLKGNHDWYTNPDIPFFKFLGLLPRVVWVNEPATGEHLKLPRLLGDEIKEFGRLLFLPHTSNHERDWPDFKFVDYDTIFCHNTFAGALGDNGAELGGIPPSIFPKGAQVISGDIHKPQVIGPVTYAGAPYTVDFGDDYAPRMLELHPSGKLRSVPCSGPQKRLVEIDKLSRLEKIKGISKGDILKVRLNITRSEHPKWHEMSAAVREWGADHGYVIHMVQPVLIDDNEKVVTDRKVSRKDDSKILKDYCKGRQVSEDTMKIGLEIMGES